MGIFLFCTIIPNSSHFLSVQGLADVAEHRDVLMAGAAVEVETSVEEPGSPVKHKRWDQVSYMYMYNYIIHELYDRHGTMYIYTNAIIIAMRLVLHITFHHFLQHTPVSCCMCVHVHVYDVPCLC